MTKLVNSMTGLINCPFCGGEAITMFDTIEGRVGLTEHYAICTECKAKGPIVQLKTLGIGDAQFAYQSVCEESIENWNKRYDKTNI